MAVVKTMMCLSGRNGGLVWVSLDAIKMSNVLREMLEVLNGVESVGEDESSVPIKLLSEQTIRQVFEWCEFHKDDYLTEPWVCLVDPSEKWDRSFYQKDTESLLELCKAADFLDIPGLLKGTCEKIAGLIRGRSVAEIREAFRCGQEQLEDIVWM